MSFPIKLHPLLTSMLALAVAFAGGCARHEPGLKDSVEDGLVAAKRPVAAKRAVAARAVESAAVRAYRNARTIRAKVGVPAPRKQLTPGGQDRDYRPMLQIVPAERPSSPTGEPAAPPRAPVIKQPQAPAKAPAATPPSLAPATAPASPAPPPAAPPAAAPPAPLPAQPSPPPQPTPPAPAPVPPQPPAAPPPTAPPATEPPAQVPAMPPAAPVPPQPAPAPPAKEAPGEPQPPPFVAPPNRVDVVPPRRNDVNTVALGRGGARADVSVEPGVDRRIAEAQSHFQRGQIGEARRLLEPLLDSMPVIAFHEMGRTYDPHYVGLLPRIDRGSDAQRAAAFYREAILQGARGAAADLERLRATHPNIR